MAEKYYHAEDLPALNLTVVPRQKANSGQTMAAGNVEDKTPRPRRKPATADDKKRKKARDALIRRLDQMALNRLEKKLLAEEKASKAASAKRALEKKTWKRDGQIVGPQGKGI
jgi:hypothetical protein